MHRTILGCTISALPKKAPASSADGRTLTNSRIISEQPLVALPAEFLLRPNGAATPTLPVRSTHRANCPCSWTSWRRFFGSSPTRCRRVPSSRPRPNRPLRTGIDQVPREGAPPRKPVVGRGLQQLPPGPSRGLHRHIGDDRQLTQLTSHHLQTFSSAHAHPDPAKISRCRIRAFTAEPGVFREISRPTRRVLA